MPLERWPIQIPSIITSVSDRNAAALRELGRLGLKPGIALTVEKRNAAGTAFLHLDNRAKRLAVNHELGGYVLVASELRNEIPVLRLTPSPGAIAATSFASPDPLAVSRCCCENIPLELSDSAAHRLLRPRSFERGACLAGTGFLNGVIGNKPFSLF